eukprot:CAMPEP_0197537130 /NCGR_PEP_ID=MMETSP1318-20131121/55908_1 /TAXON_ID=552666 /ORGANISM="Partenskyella glossopodia, Strain RCC365" /LENGTH=443 /DNA_ID=CAMNT_0043095225 /DNA_START=345 /DNA_END=1676 /DNA_ORIENTATION=-
MALSVLSSPKTPLPVQLDTKLKNLKLDNNANKRNGGGAENKTTAEKEKPKGDAIIFVGDLSRTVKDKDLRAVMEQHGTVVNVDIKRDRVTNNNLGYGFVQFENHEQALKAKKALHGVEVGGRKIRTGWAQRNTSLFVGDLDSFVNEGVYRKAFARFGNLVEEETYFKVDKGFGMVKFKTRENAETAKAELNGKKIGQSNRPVRVMWGDTSVQKHCVHVKFDVGKEVKSFQDNEISEDVLNKVFSEYGKVVTVNLPRHGDQTLKGYGFVHYEDTEKGEESAKKAIAHLSGTKIGRLVIQCNYGRKHSKRRSRNGNMGGSGGGSGSNIRGHPGHMYMYQYPPQSGNYPAMMYPIQNPYVYQAQVNRGRPPPGASMYPPYGYQQMNYYQYGQGQANSNSAGPAPGQSHGQDVQNEIHVDYGMNMNPDHSFDGHMHMGMHDGRIHQR